MIDAVMLLPGCLCEPHECGRSVHCTDTYTVLGRSLTQTMFHRGSSTSSCAMETMAVMMISSSYPHDELIIASQPMVAGVPRGCTCKVTRATVNYRYNDSHKIPCYQCGLDCMSWKIFCKFLTDQLGLNLTWDLCSVLLVFLCFVYQIKAKQNLLLCLLSH